MTNIDELYKAKWAMVWLIFIVQCIQFLGFSAYSTQSAAIMADLSLGYSEFAMIASFAAVGQGITFLFVGVLGDYWSPKKLVTIGIALMGVGQLMFGLVDNWALILASRFVTGVGVAGVISAGFSLAAKWMSRSDAAGASYAIMMCADGVGGVLALVGFAFVMQLVGWRMGSIVIAVIYLVATIVCIVWLKDYPEQKENAVLLRKTNPNPLSSLWVVFRNRNVIGGGAVVVGQAVTYGIATFWIPTVIMEGAGWSETVAGMCANAYPLVAIPFMLVAPKLLEGKNLKPYMIGFGVVATLAWVACSLALKADAYPVLVVLLGVLGAFTYMASSLGFGVAERSVGAKNAAIATAIIQLFAMGVGGTVFPLLIGMAKDMTGSYVAGFIIMAICVLVLMVLLPMLVKLPKEMVDSKK